MTGFSRSSQGREGQVGEGRDDEQGVEDDGCLKGSQGETIAGVRVARIGSQVAG